MGRNRLSNSSCWKQAQQVLVGGVNSPVRSFSSVGTTPFFADRGQGPYLWDVEGRKLLDYVSSWGALILGHRHPKVIQAAQRALKRGTTFGTPTPLETALAQKIQAAMPSMEKIRFVSSGTEAVMSAVRLARAATGRSKILKFEGGYHGHLDALLTKAGSGLATLGLPGSPGVPKAVTRDTLTIPFNDKAAFTQVIRRHGKQLACVLVEPVQANIGVIPPVPGFLQLLRKLTREKGILLIFDEVITGFRVDWKGAQGKFRVQPDLTTLGKVIGGGFPIGAYGGKRIWMKQVAPDGPVYQAGTLAGHPVAMAAGLATLQVLKEPGTYRKLEKKAQQLKAGLEQISDEAGVPVTINQAGGLLSLFFTDKPVQNGSAAKKSDSRKFTRYFRKMLDQGVYLPPSPFEAWFVSTALGEKEIQKTLQAHKTALKAVQ